MLCNTIYKYMNIYMYNKSSKRVTNVQHFDVKQLKSTVEQIEVNVITRKPVHVVFVKVRLSPSCSVRKTRQSRENINSNVLYNCLSCLGSERKDVAQVSYSQLPQ